jgi:hypothetical protein
MSITHGIFITIKADFNTTIIQQILQQGLDHDFIYLESYDSTSKTIDVPALIERILLEPRDENSLIDTKYHDTYFSLGISPTEKNRIRVSVGSFSYAWKKQFSNSQSEMHIDFARYIYLMLRLCRGFSILEIETYSV